MPDECRFVVAFDVACPNIAKPLESGLLRGSLGSIPRLLSLSRHMRVCLLKCPCYYAAHSLEVLVLAVYLDNSAEHEVQLVPLENFPKCGFRIWFFTTPSFLFLVVIGVKLQFYTNFYLCYFRGIFLVRLPLMTTTKKQKNEAVHGNATLMPFFQKKERLMVIILLS